MPDDPLFAHFELDRLRDQFIFGVLGSGARGIDRLSAKQFQGRLSIEVETIRRKCRDGSYRFAPYLESLRSKGRGRMPRVISIATVRDRLVLASVKEFLHEQFPECVARRLPNEYIRALSNAFITDPTAAATKLDIKSFYESIQHARLINILSARLSPTALRIVEKALRNPTVQAGYRGAKTSNLLRNGVGVPQGLSISNILAEIYVHAVDVSIVPICLHYYRYVDDILIIENVSNKGAALKRLDETLTDIGLTLAPEKRRDGPFSMCFDYLGYELELPRVSVRRTTAERFLASIAAEFASFQHAAALRYRGEWLDQTARKAIFLDELNERISGAISEKRRYGWLFYFSEINDEPLLYRLDAVIDTLWKRFFGEPRPSSLKRLVRAYYEGRFRPTEGYVVNYNSYVTLSSKVAFLVRRGVLNPRSRARYTEDQINEMFLQLRRRRLSRLDADVGEIS